MDLGFMTLKLISAFFILITYIKISGRKQISPLSPSDQISNMVIGGLMGSCIVSANVSIGESIIIMSIWASLQLLIRHLKYRSARVTEFIDGKRYRLISDGLVNKGELMEAKVSIMDLENSLHGEGIKSISSVKNAYFDPSGHISFDLKDEESQSNVLIFNGNFHKDSLDRLGIDEEWLRRRLEEEGISRLEDIICVEHFNKRLFVFKDRENIVIRLDK